MIIVYVDNDNLQFTKYESVLTSLFVNKKSFFKIFTNEYDLSKMDESFKNRHKFIVSNNKLQYRSIDLLASSLPGIGKSIPSGSELLSNIATIGIPSLIDSLMAKDS